MSQTTALKLSYSLYKGAELCLVFLFIPNVWNTVWHRGVQQYWSNKRKMLKSKGTSEVISVHSPYFTDEELKVQSIGETKVSPLFCGQARI